MRDDIKLAAYAVFLGYTLKFDGVAFHDGRPNKEIEFHLGAVTVWRTARGWRASAAVNGTFPSPDFSEFHATLLSALRAGVSLNA